MPERAPAADPPLCAQGRAQAAWLGEQLRPLVDRVGGGLLVLTSPLSRTRQTADALGLGPAGVRAELAPRRTGPVGAGRGTTSWDERPAGGESLRDVADRLRAPLANWLVRARAGDGAVVLVSHSEIAFVLRSLVEEHWSRDPLARAADGRAIHVPEWGSAIVYGENGRGYLPATNAGP
jgi:broad specificity phosphatase PhoE